MDVMFDVFRLSVPLWTDSFSQALVSIGKFHFTSSLHCHCCCALWSVDDFGTSAGHPVKLILFKFN